MVLAELQTVTTCNKKSTRMVWSSTPWQFTWKKKGNFIANISYHCIFLTGALSRKMTSNFGCYKDSNGHSGVLLTAPGSTKSRETASPYTASTSWDTSYDFTRLELWMLQFTFLLENSITVTVPTSLNGKTIWQCQVQAYGELLQNCLWSVCTWRIMVACGSSQYPKDH